MFLQQEEAKINPCYALACSTDRGQREAEPSARLVRSTVHPIRSGARSNRILGDSGRNLQGVSTMEEKSKKVKPLNLRTAWINDGHGIQVLGVVPHGTDPSEVELPYPELQKQEDVNVAGYIELARDIHDAGFLHTFEKKLPKIVCLCGSTKFKKQFIDSNYKETLAGNIVLTVGWFSHTDGDTWYPSDDEKRDLDELHKRKIDLADEILVIDTDGYIGESTRSEIDYAEKHGKRIRYLSTKTR